MERIKRELRRGAAVEPVIAHLKAEHRMGRNYLWSRLGETTNSFLAAAGYNFCRLIRWLSFLPRPFLTAETGAMRNILEKDLTHSQHDLALPGSSHEP